MNGFDTAIRQATLAFAYDFSVVTDGEFGSHGVTWAGQPSIARLRFLYPDATLEEATTASEACRAWAEQQELSHQAPHSSSEGGR